MGKIKTKAVILGKFMPLHKGHLALIDFALTQCDTVKVLVLVDKYEPIEYINRSEYFNDIKDERIEVITLYYDSIVNGLCATNEPKEEYAKKWVEFLSNNIFDCTHIISSEQYGKNIAKFSHLEHICFDHERSIVPISATEIRENHIANFSFMSKEAQRLNQKLVFILGTESTGKTTIVERLAKHFNCKFVEEAGRRLVKSSTICTEDIFEVIAETHDKDIKKAINTEPYTPYIFVDTDWHITQSYAYFIYHTNIKYREQKGLRFYLSRYVPFIQDGTRLSEVDRNLLDLNHRYILDKYNVQFTEINKTDYDKRFETIKNKLK